MKYLNNDIIYQSRIWNGVLPKFYLQSGHVCKASLQSSIKQGRQDMHTIPKEHINNKQLAIKVSFPGLRVTIVSTLFVYNIILFYYNSYIQP